MEKLVKKLFKNRVDIRSYEREHCISNKESMTITYKNEKMTLTPRELKNKIKAKSQLFTSKVGMDDYYLYAYEWNPNKKQQE